MKNLTSILVPALTKEIRYLDTTIEIWVKNKELKIEDVESEKTKYNNLLQILNLIEEDYDTLIMLIKICKSCPILDRIGVRLSAADIKSNLLKSITDEYEVRDYLLTERTKEVEKLKPIEELPKEVIKEKLPNG